MPEAFEIYDYVNGHVFLRRKQRKLIHDEEIARVEKGLDSVRGKNLYKVAVRGGTLTTFESADHLGAPAGAFSPFPSRDRARREDLPKQFASYQAMMRFVLVDETNRLFAPERYCFRGSVDDWISIGPPAPVKQLLTKYLKHLGQESFFEF